MKKHTKAFAILLFCLLLCCATVFGVSAEGMIGANNGGIAGNGVSPRTGEEGGIMNGVESAIGDVTGAIGDVTDAVNDAAGALTDDANNNGAMDSGTNMPEDSNGVITDTDEIGGSIDDSAEATTVTGTATDAQENAPAEVDTENGFVGIIVAIIIAIAVILLIIALMPRKRIE